MVSAFCQALPSEPAGRSKTSNVVTMKPAIESVARLTQSRTAAGAARDAPTKHPWLCAIGGALVALLELPVAAELVVIPAGAVGVEQNSADSAPLGLTTERFQQVYSPSLLGGLTV